MTQPSINDAAAFFAAVTRQSLFEHDTRLRRTLLDLQLWFPNP